MLQPSAKSNQIHSASGHVKELLTCLNERLSFDICHADQNILGGWHKISTVSLEVNEKINPNFLKDAREMFTKAPYSRHGSSDIAAEAITRTEYAITQIPIRADFSTSPLYARRKEKRLSVRQSGMAQKTLAERIPDGAAECFAIGIVVILASLIALAFTDNHLPKLIMAGGLAMAATGLRIGERAIASVRRAQ